METKHAILTTGAALAMIAFALAGPWAMAADEGQATPGAIEFTDVREQTRQFIEWNATIALTPEQEEIKREALSAIPAPCCGDKTAHTCCCSCNMAKSWWGLSKHLIANEGYDAEQVRAAVVEWFEFINPDGFSGRACYTGGCSRPFHRDGCGGMSTSKLIF